jgi:hypothetical protein
VQWTVRGIARAARDEATQAATAQGMKVAEWLETAIHRAAASPPGETAPGQAGVPDAYLHDTLAEIRERLIRLEERRGVLTRFWDYLLGK